MLGFTVSLFTSVTSSADTFPASSCAFTFILHVPSFSSGIVLSIPEIFLFSLTLTLFASYIS